MKRFILDAATGETELVDLDDAEIAELETQDAEATERRTERENETSRRLAILERLGLTEDEAKLILG